MENASMAGGGRCGWEGTVGGDADAAGAVGPGGLRALGDGGLDAVRIEPLAQALGVTKGRVLLALRGPGGAARGGARRLGAGQPLGRDRAGRARRRGRADAAAA